jgi:hypothetical protein
MSSMKYHCNRTTTAIVQLFIKNSAEDFGQAKALKEMAVPYLLQAHTERNDSKSTLTHTYTSTYKRIVDNSLAKALTFPER